MTLMNGFNIYFRTPNYYFLVKKYILKGFVTLRFNFNLGENWKC